MSENNIDQHSLHTGRNFPWHEVYAPDADKAVAFYTEALGFETTVMDMGPQGTYTMLSRNGMGLAGVMATNTPEMAGVPPHWAVYIAVDNVDARVEKSLSLGAKLIVPAMDIPTVGRMALLQDPQGATFWVFTPVS